MITNIDEFKRIYEGAGDFAALAKAAMELFRKDGFLERGDRPTYGTLDISRFNGEGADIHPGQTTVQVSGVKRYMKRMRSGERPFVLVGRDTLCGGYRVVDGHHRLKAYELLGVKEIPVIDRDGMVGNLRVNEAQHRHANIFTALDAFLASREAETRWLSDGNIEVYAMKSSDRDKLYIANVTVEQPGRGTGKRFFAELTARYQHLTICVVNIVNPALVHILDGLGFEKSANFEETRNMCKSRIQ